MSNDYTDSHNQLVGAEYIRMKDDPTKRSGVTEDHVTQPEELNEGGDVKYDVLNNCVSKNPRVTRRDGEYSHLSYN